MDWLDQGTILASVHSGKYPTTHCYGIIITARCDIANDKVSKLYFLVSVDAKSWICNDEIYRQIYKDKIKNARNEFSKVMEKCELNSDVLLNFSCEEALSTIREIVSDSQMCAKAEQAYCNMIQIDYKYMTDEERNAHIQADKKPVLDFLKRINKGEIIHYFYLPQDAYMNDGTMNNGLIVDFQEIESIAMQDMKGAKIKNINYLLFSSYETERRQRLEKIFWLEKHTDFVKVIGTIKSPWREYLMQRFSFAFSRIGVDGPDPEDFGQLICNLAPQEEAK